MKTALNIDGLLTALDLSSYKTVEFEATYRHPETLHGQVKLGKLNYTKNKPQEAYLRTTFSVIGMVPLGELEKHVTHAALIHVETDGTGRQMQNALPYLLFPTHTLKRAYLYVPGSFRKANRTPALAIEDGIITVNNVNKTFAPHARFIARKHGISVSPSPHESRAQ